MFQITTKYFYLYNTILYDERRSMKIEEWF